MQAFPPPCRAGAHHTAPSAACCVIQCPASSQRRARRDPGRQPSSCMPLGSRLTPRLQTPGASVQHTAASLPSPQPDSSLSVDEADQLIANASHSWEAMCAFLTAHSCHLPAACVPQLCIAVLRLTRRPLMSSPASPRPYSASPFTKYPQLLQDLIHACSSQPQSQVPAYQPHHRPVTVIDAAQHRLDPTTGGMPESRSHSASGSGRAAVDLEAGQSVLLLGFGSAADRGTLHAGLMSELHSQHDEEYSWPAAPSAADLRTHTRTALQDTAPDSRQAQSYAASPPSRSSHVWHAAASRRSPVPITQHYEAACRTLSLLCSAVTSDQGCLAPRRLSSPAHAVLAVVCLSELAVLLSMTQASGCNAATITASGSGVRITVCPACHSLSLPVCQLTDWVLSECSTQLQQGMKRDVQRQPTAVALALALTIRAGSGCSSSSGERVGDGSIDLLVGALQVTVQSGPLPAQSASALLWALAVHHSRNPEAPRTPVDDSRALLSIIAQLRPGDLSPDQLLDCLWAVLHLPVDLQHSGSAPSITQTPRHHILYSDHPAALVLECVLHCLLLPPPAQHTDAPGADRHPSHTSVPPPGHLSPGHIITALVLLAKANLRLQGHILVSLQQVFTHEVFTTLPPGQLAVLAWALARMKTGLQAKRLRTLLLGFQQHLHGHSSMTVSHTASLVWALPHISKPYTRSMASQQRPLLRVLASATLPAIIQVASPPDEQQGSDAGAILGGHPPVQLMGSAGPRELVQLAVGFTQLGFYPGASWMRAHRQACLKLQDQFSQADRQRLRAAYQALLVM